MAWQFLPAGISEWSVFRKWGRRGWGFLLALAAKLILELNSWCNHMGIVCMFWVAGRQILEIIKVQ